MFDYLIVGLGLAGVSFCEQLEKSGKTFHVISNDSQNASSVAGGLYNPVILKRFTKAWKAKEQLAKAKPFYHSLEEKLGVKLDYGLSVKRRFASVEEQNLWFEAADKLGVSDFILPEIQDNGNPHIDAPFGFGKVDQTGRIDTKKMLDEYRKYLEEKGQLTRAAFNYAKLSISESYTSYNSIKADKVIFSEGFGLKDNPFFKYLPLNGTKGEYVVIHAPELQEHCAVKASIFCIPLGKDYYKIGANYDKEDKTDLPTQKTRKVLLEKLEAFVKCDYKVVGQVAGVRPTVIDRRPLVGQHPKHKNLYVLNGFGSRGLLIAPYAAEQLFQHIEAKTPLDSEMNVQRFEKLQEISS